VGLPRPSGGATFGKGNPEQVNTRHIDYQMEASTRENKEEIQVASAKCKCETSTPYPKSTVVSRFLAMYGSSGDERSETWLHRERVTMVVMGAEKGRSP
jgi:hypothetical protein